MRRTGLSRRDWRHCISLPRWIGNDRWPVRHTGGRHTGPHRWQPRSRQEWHPRRCARHRGSASDRAREGFGLTRQSLEGQGGHEMAEAYCVKDKQKVEIQNPREDHHEEWQARDQGHVPEVRRQRVPHRRLTSPSRDAQSLDPGRMRLGSFFASPGAPASHCWTRPVAVVPLDSRTSAGPGPGGHQCPCGVVECRGWAVAPTREPDADGRQRHDRGRLTASRC